MIDLCEPLAKFAPLLEWMYQSTKWMVERVLAMEELSDFGLLKIARQRNADVTSFQLSCSEWGISVGKTGTTPSYSSILDRLRFLSASPLDFIVESDDTSINLLAAPLLYPVMCPYSDVHHWRVFLLPNLKLDLSVLPVGDLR